MTTKTPARYIRLLLTEQQTSAVPDGWHFHQHRNRERKVSDDQHEKFLEISKPFRDRIDMLQSRLNRLEAFAEKVSEAFIHYEAYEGSRAHESVLSDALSTIGRAIHELKGE